jgi:hypothetical protein
MGFFMSITNRDLASVYTLGISTNINNVQREYGSQTALPTAMLNGRLAANGTPISHLDCMTSVLKKVNNFFAHRYADFRMFVVACRSIRLMASNRAVEQRVNQVIQFLSVVKSGENSREAVRESFQGLSPPVRSLFYRIDQNYIDEFVEESSSTEEMRRELIRECEQVIYFQRQLVAVSNFCVRFIERLRGNLATASNVRQRSQPRGGSSSSSTVPSIRFNLDVPGTIPYLRDAIPNDVQNKANEINALKEEFNRSGSNAPDIPEMFKDVIAMDFMAIPIFDASHPGIQDAMRAMSAPDATSAASDALDDRNLRHIFDKESLEGHMQARSNSWAPPKCPLCRHPEDGGIRHEYLRIDTELQNQILHFLRTHVGRREQMN